MAAVYICLLIGFGLGFIRGIQQVVLHVMNFNKKELTTREQAMADAAEEAAAACLKGRTLADEIAALAALTVEDANALLQTALREENRAYVQIDPAE